MSIRGKKATFGNSGSIRGKSTTEERISNSRPKIVVRSYEDVNPVMAYALRREEEKKKTQVGTSPMTDQQNWYSHGLERAQRDLEAMKANGASPGSIAAQEAEVKSWQERLNNASARVSEDKARPVTGLERALLTLEASGKNYAGTLQNTGGFGLETLGKLNDAAFETEYADEIRAAKNSHDYWTKVLAETQDEEERQRAQMALERANSTLQNIADLKELQSRAVDSAAGRVYEKADKKTEEAEQLLQKAKYGAGDVGQFLVDVGYGGSQLAADVGIGLATGGGAMIPMAARVFGGSTQEARRAGASYEQQLGYGVASTALSVGTEKIFSLSTPLSKAFGGGVADDVVTKLSGKLNGSAAGRLVLNALSEGSEEMIEAIVEPQLKKIYDSNAGYDADTISNVLYSGLLGAVLGGGMGAVGEVMDAQSAKANYGESARELAEESLALDPKNRTAKRTIERLDKNKSVSGAMLNNMVRQNEATMLKRGITEETMAEEERKARGEYTEEESVQRLIDALTSESATEEEMDAAAAKWEGYKVDEDVAKERRKVAAQTMAKAYSAPVSDFSEEEARYIINEGAKEFGNAASSVVNSYVRGQDPQLYMAQAKLAFNYGKTMSEEKGLPYALKSSSLKSLDETQIRSLFNAGRMQAKSIPVSAVKGTGKAVLTDGLDYTLLSPKQKKQVDALSAFAKATGYTIEFFESKTDAEGNYTAEQGSFNTKTGVIRIDINAGKNNVNDLANYAMVRVASHEITHSFKKNAPQQYVALRDYVTGILADKGEFDDLVDTKMRDLGIDRETAVDEVVADGCEMLLRDTRFAEKLAKENRTLFEKIRDAIRKFVKKLRDAFEGVEIAHEEAALLKDAENLQKLWDEALARSVENVAAAKHLNAGTQSGKLDAVKTSLREDLRNGKARKEDRESFLRRATGEGLRIFEGENAAYGYRPVRWESSGENARQVQRELTELGIDAEIIEGDIFWNLNGISSTRKVPQATTVEKKKIFVNAVASLEPKNAAGHEAYHLWSETVDGAAYQEEVRANINFSSKSFVRYQSAIANAYAKKLKIKGDKAEIDVNDEDQLAALMEEVFAYISGDIHEGVNDDFLRPMFVDYDAVKAAWSKLCEHQRSDAGVVYSKRTQKKFEALSYKEISEMQQELFQRERSLTERKREANNNPELLQAMDDFHGLFDEMRELLPKRRQGTATQAELDRIDKIKALRDQKLQRVSELQESLGLKAMEEEYAEIRQMNEALRVAADAAWKREGAERENAAIAKAGVSAQEYFRKKALKAFKTTTNFNEAGYLLPDGKLLNFSGGERNHRYRDHREIGEIYEATQGAEALNRFLSDGNIRIMAESPGIDLASGVEPTAEQYAAIRRFVKSHGTQESQFFVDFSDVDGHKAGSYAYEGRVNADRVINDIKYYYANGEVREQSVTSQYHYSFRTGKTIDSNQSEIQINDLRQQIDQIDDELWFADGVEEISLRNKRVKLRAQLDKLLDAERKATKLTSLRGVLDNLEQYRRGDLESIANQLSDGAWDEVETLSTEELIDGIREIIADRELNALEMQSPQYGVYVRPVEPMLYSFRTGYIPTDRSILTSYVPKDSDSDTVKKHIAEYQKNAKELKAMQLKRGQMVHDLEALADNNDPKSRAEKKRLREEIVKTDSLIQGLLDQLSRKERWYGVKEVLQKEKTEIMRKAKAEKNEQLKKYREQRWDTENRRKMRERISYRVKTLDKMLRNPTDDKHIPDGLQSAILDFCEAFTENTSVFSKKRLDSIRAEYSSLEGKVSETSLADLYDESIKEMLEYLGEVMSGKRLSELNMEQLSMVRDIADHFAFMVKNENEVFLNGRKVKMQTIATKAIEEAKESEKKGGLTIGRDGEAFAKFLTSGNLKPVYLFERTGDQLRDLFNGLLAGQSEYGRREQKAKAFVEQVKKDTNYSEWSSSEETLKMTNGAGQQIELTVQQSMSLLATYERELRQGLFHVTKGGFVYENGVTGDVTVKGVKVPVVKRKVEAEAHPMTADDMDKVRQWLGSIDSGTLDYMERMVEYLSTTMAAYGNETSMQLHGYKKFSEGYYFPIRSSDDYLNKDPGKGGFDENRWKNKGFTKALTKSANNPFVLIDFDKVWSNHVSQMLMYSTMAVPQESFVRVLNFKTPVDPTGLSNSESMRSVIKQYYGSKVADYIDTLLRDVNGGVTTDSRATVLNRLVSTFKKNATFASASVVVQQISSVARATALIAPKHFAGGNPVDGFKEALEHSGVAVIKQMGGFDTTTGRGGAEWLMEETPKGWKNKAKALTQFGEKDTGYRDRVFSILPAKMDELGFGMIWNAVKNEVSDSGEYKDGTEAFYVAVTKRFEEVIEKTQVYDSVLSRSENMRGKDGLLKAATSFMAEPTVTANMMMDAAWKLAHNKDKESGKYLGRVIASLLFAMIANNLLKAAATAPRDKDEDQTILEKYVEDVFGGIKSDINPFGYVPFLRDIKSIWEGYTVEASYAAPVADAIDAFKDVRDDRSFNSWVNLVMASSGFFGLPLKNIKRDLVDSFINLFGKTANLSESSTRGLRNAILEGWNGELHGVDDAMEKAYRADKRGNEAQRKKALEEVKKLYEDKVKQYRLEGKDEPVKKAKSSLKSSITAELKPLYQAATTQAEKNRIKSLALRVYVGGEQLYNGYDFERYWGEE